MSDETTTTIERGDRVLGTGAAGDIEDPGKRLNTGDLAKAKVAELKEALATGQVTPEQVAEAEATRDEPRSTVQNLVGDAGGDDDS